MDGAFRPGTILLEKYRVESVLGRGGMGVVLKVTHLQLGEELALKILSPEAVATPDVHARFLREAQSVVRLRGEHVARVFDVGILPGGVPYMVMEYLRGVDLAGELDRRKTLMPGEAVDYVLQACEALAEAHANAVVHRDIKPANLFLTARPDGTPLIKVLDFGISKVPFSTSGVVTKTNVVMGTPGYMSPEQMKATRDVDARTDIWALGIVLYECLSGRRPFEGESFSAVVLMAGTEPPPPMDPRIPRGLQGAVLRCLEKDRSARFSSIAELAEALVPFARDQRAAALVVDRAKLMLQRPGSVSELAAHAAQSPPSTTLSGSAGVAGSRARRRYAIAGVLSVLGSIAVLVAATLQGTGPSRSSSAGSGIEPGSYDAGRPVADRVATPSSPADAEVRLPATTMLDGAAAPTTADSIDMDKTSTLGKCVSFQAERDWQALADCASKLDAFGLKDKAREFHAVVTQEVGNKVQAGKVQQALRDRDLKKAQALLRAIGDGSVYFASLNDAFLKVETPAFDEASRKAQSFANAHDCAALKRYVAQVVVVSTERVAAAAQAVKCVDKAPSMDSTAVRTPVVGGSGSAQLPDSSFLPVDSTAVKTPVVGGGGSAQAPDSTAVKTPVVGGGGSAQAPDSPPAPKNPCDTMNVDDVLIQAQNQYNASYAKPALSLVMKALACKQSVTMYRIAAMYACAAHDLLSAKLYFSKVPPSLQPAIEQKCQQEGLNLRSP